MKSKVYFTYIFIKSNDIESLRNGSCDTGFVSKMMLDRRDKSCPGEDRLDLTNIISVPLFDHCQFDSLPSLSKEKINAFQSALFKMDWNKEIDRVVMQSEGIREKWEKRISTPELEQQRLFHNHTL